MMSLIKLGRGYRHGRRQLRPAPDKALPLPPQQRHKLRRFVHLPQAQGAFPLLLDLFGHRNGSLQRRAQIALVLLLPEEPGHVIGPEFDKVGERAAAPQSEPMPAGVLPDRLGLLLGQPVLILKGALETVLAEQELVVIQLRHRAGPGQHEPKGVEPLFAHIEPQRAVLPDGSHDGAVANFTIRETDRKNFAVPQHFPQFGFLVNKSQFEQFVGKHSSSLPGFFNHTI